MHTLTSLPSPSQLTPVRTFTAKLERTQNEKYGNKQKEAKIMLAMFTIGRISYKPLFKYNCFFQRKTTAIKGKE